MIKLPNVTLLAASSVKIEQTIKSLVISSAEIKFGEVVLVSHEKPKNLPENISFKEYKKMNNLNDYSAFCLYDLCEYVNTDFVLLVQYDSHVLRPEKWKNYFLDYDYIGAPWPANVHFNGEKNIRVGNGGFSIRSKKLLKIFNELNLKNYDGGTGFYNEDGQICNYYRPTLEKNGIKFAPVNVASQFSHELDCHDSVEEPFGFHKYKK